jgi:hypothetical protein
MSASKPAAAPMASVFNDDGRCLGFALQRRLAGFKALDRDDNSLGMFETPRQAANALLLEAGGS